ncbi:tRNA pseudouridine(38-40) synthase TruA [Halorhodospira abdelmalekii]|uniref:tRNA pseudouridine(38-40) synthase TruA n=1 Tax=Halorhodospira abdelmalekii TaxID=421629 RepID=UPI001906754C|nr:tRNA pseudouridine(38-40) synthase TruA [Halorhodospira abdelmalekii]MBK1734294.1 tRNA pseudouridine(38-40) synthase TruA [Halorhodospira abdelmalekii]
MGELDEPVVSGACRIALVVEYDGSEFSGWQRQHHAPSVQEALEGALSRVAAEPIELVCAGRTDAGVHATHQVVHFDTRAKRPLHAWVLGSNANLPASVSVLSAHAVADDFHARYRARRRAYRYVFLCRRARPALARSRVAWTHHELDAARMHESAQALLGEHDFSAFRAVACQAAHAVREVQRLSVERRGAQVIIDITANAFLHHMVRNIAGTLLAVGTGEQGVGWPAQLLAGRDRRRSGITAPASGLYLTGVEYPAEYGIPSGLDAAPPACSSTSSRAPHELGLSSAVLFLC